VLEVGQRIIVGRPYPVPRLALYLSLFELR
jgi:hypothetical protein